MKKKRMLLFVVIAIIIILVICAIIFISKKENKSEEETHNINTKLESEITQVDTYIGQLEDGTKINTNAKMNATTTIGNLSIDNIRLTLKNGVTTFRANVTNNGENKTELKSVTLILLGENGEKLVSAKGLISQIEKGESQELAISITSDYINAYGYEIIED